MSARLISMDEILAFCREHISLADIAEAEIFSPDVMKMKPDSCGLVPLTPKCELGRLILCSGEINCGEFILHPVEDWCV
jgi:hypothetical protein